MMSRTENNLHKDRSGREGYYKDGNGFTLAGRFSYNEKLFEVGDEIFPGSLTNFVIPDEVYYPKKSREVFLTLCSGIPFVVTSEPYRYDRGYYKGEYFVKVSPKGSDEIYEMVNSYNLIMRDYNRFQKWVDEFDISFIL